MCVGMSTCVYYVCVCVCVYVFVCVKIAFCMCECQKLFVATLPHRGVLPGKDLSKWVTFPTASPVVNLMGSLSPHGHCYDSPVTNYHPKPINTSAMEEWQHVKTTEAAES